MPDAPEIIRLRGEDGTVTAVPISQAGHLIEAGWTPETGREGADRASTEARAETYGGIKGTVLATGAGAARGLSLGLSDVALAGAGYGEDLAGYQEVNPIASTVGEVGGALAGSLVAPGSLLAKTPAGMVTNLGARVAELGEAGGTIARVAAATGGAALEGALQNAGSYVSDVALGNRELSADGFIGAMGKGALWGGVAGGSLALASSGLTAARRLFPKQEVTREAVQAAEDVARREVASAVEDGETLATAARDRLRQIRADRAALDLETKTKLDDIAVRKAQELADAQVSKAKAQAETAQVRLESAKTGRRARKALQDEGSGAAPVAKGELPGAAPDVPATTVGDVVTGATDDATTLLERQLGAMKQGLDAGASLSDLAAQRPGVVGLKTTHVEDALNAEIAKVDPEAARLVKGLDELESGRDAMSTWLDKYKGGKVSQFERNQAARDQVAGWRKTEGYVDTVPAGEGNIALPRGRQSVWRGSEDARALEDARTMSKLDPEEQLRADDAVERAFARRQARDVAEDVVESKTAPAVDEQVQTALHSRVDSIDDDIAESASAIGRHEAASAELTDALGPMAPPTSQARAQAFREAQQKSETSAAEHIGRATADAERAAETISLGGTPPAARGKMAGLLSGAQDVASAAEMLRMMGVDLPDPRNIPVIGPVLSMYLKARVASKAFGRFGGKIAETAETTIAKKAAGSRERVFAAVDKMLDLGARGARVAAKRSGGPAAALGHVLFADHDQRPSRPYSSEAPKGSIAETYLARADEVTRAMQPGAIERSIRARIKTSDTAVLDAIVAAQQRKLEFLDKKMPRAPEPPVPTGPQMPWIPSKADITRWSRYVEAAEDPAGVLESAANGGHLTVEGVETLKTVYPQLYAEAQQRILTRAMDRKDPIPYARRVQLSVLFDMPFDMSHTPEGAAFLQSTYQPTPPAAPPQPATGAPTVVADVRMSERTNPASKEL